MIMLEVFISQFMVIFLLGLQSLLVHRDEKLLAAINGALIAVFNFQILTFIAHAISSLSSPEGIAFVIASSLGIVAAMYAHAFLQSKLKQWRSRKADYPLAKEPNNGQ